MAVRSALLRAGSNLWQPLDLNMRLIRGALGGSGGDDEVSRALEQLLAGVKQRQVRRDWPLVLKRGHQLLRGRLYLRVHQLLRCDDHEWRAGSG